MTKQQKQAILIDILKDNIEFLLLLLQEKGVTDEQEIVNARLLLDCKA